MKRLFARLLLPVCILLLLSGCSRATVSAARIEDFSALVGQSGFSFAVPMELPAGFLRTSLFWENGRTCCVLYENGSRTLEYLAAKAETDGDLKAAVKELAHEDPVEIDGLRVRFYTAEGDLEGTGTAAWEEGDIAYCLRDVTLQEAAGMLYSRRDLALSQGDLTIGRPRQAFDTLESLETTLEMRLPQPSVLADNYAFTGCYSVGGIIAVSEYSNGTDKLLYQASRSPLIYAPDETNASDKTTLFGDTDHPVTVDLPYVKGVSARNEARWTIDGVCYRHITEGEATREQLLTMAREFCFWLEDA